MISRRTVVSLIPNRLIRYFCLEPNALSGSTSDNYHDLLCGDDGTFPTGWPECDVRCPVPNTPSGFADPALTEGSVAVGGEITYTCENTEAEVGSTLSGSYTVR